MNLYENIVSELSFDTQCDEKIETIAVNELTRVITANEVTVYRDKNLNWFYTLTNGTRSLFIKSSEDYKRFSIVRSQDAEDLCVTKDSTRFLLRTAFECRFCYEGIVSLHAACVEKDGEAVAFTGVSGLGKSTRARAWAEALGAEWISGDRPAVRIEKDGSTACGVPWDGKEQIFRDVEVPLKAILEVRRSDANYIRKLSPEQARKLLMKQTFVPMWDTDAAVMAMANVRKLIQKTPVYRVFCGPSADDARAIYDILYHHPELIREEKKDMKVKEGFVLRNVVDEHIVMPTGDNIAKFEGAVVLNDVAAFVFELLKNPVSKEDVLSAILNEFEVDEETAKSDLDNLLEKLTELNIIEA